MNVNSGFRIQLKPLVHLFLVFMFIYISDDTVLFGTNANSGFVNGKYLFICGMSIVLFIYSFLKKPSVQTRVAFIFVILSVLILTTMFLNNDIRLGYFYKVALILYSIGLLRVLGFDELKDCFCKIIYVISAISLFLFALYMIVPGIFSIFPTLTNSAGNRFYNAFLYVQPAWSSASLRNYGIFREPGVYQMYVIVALLFTIANEQKSEIKKVIVLVVTVITTVSTTGYIALAVVILIYLRKKTNVTKNQKKIIMMVVSLGVLYLLTNTNLFSFDKEHQYESVFYKLTDITRWTTIARFASVTENIRIMLIKPIFGVGLAELDRLFPMLALENYGFASTHNTNTFLIQFAAHGVVYGTLYIWGYVKFAKRLAGSRDWLLYFFVFVILFMGENLTFSGFASLMLMSGFYYNSSAVRSSQCEISSTHTGRIEEVRKELEI